VKLLLTSEQIDLFKKGDNSPLNVIYHDFSVQLVFIAYRYVKNTDEAKDITMEVFDKLLRMAPEKRRRIPAEPDGFKNWIFLVTKNYCLDVIKHNKIVLQHRQQVAEMEMAVRSDAERKWDAEMVARVLSRLPAAEQEVCRMHYDGFSHEEIAKSLDISYYTVRNQLSSGKKKIRKYISGELIVLLFLILI
jgi:RNA polymerase sigma factor (sigma-70 family)